MRKLFTSPGIVLIISLSVFGEDDFTQSRKSAFGRRKDTIVVILRLCVYFAPLRETFFGFA